MRIRSVAVNMTQDDFDLIQQGCDWYERRRTAPRGHGSVREFLLEAGLEMAKKMIVERNAKFAKGATDAGR